MMANIVVERQHSDLDMTRWSFMISDHHIVPARYEQLTRQSKRHAFRVTDRWDRYDGRNNTRKAGDVRVPADVADEVLEQIRRRFVVELPTWVRA